MEGKHTPGPWEVLPGTCFIRANDPYEPDKGKMMVAQANRDEWSDAPAPEGKLTVATARGWGRLQYLGVDKAIAIQDANARLIAAAPEMLTALGLAVQALNAAPRFRVGDTDSYKIASIAEAAVAKAKGEA